MSTREAKLVVRAKEREESRRRWKRRRRHWRCFWIPPFGHAYELTEAYTTIMSVYQCAGCGKQIRR